MKLIQEIPHPREETKQKTTHSINANLYPMQALLPFNGFPFKKVRIFEYSPGIAFACPGGFAQRSGLDIKEI